MFYKLSSLGQKSCKIQRQRKLENRAENGLGEATFIATFTLSKAMSPRGCKAKQLGNDKASIFSNFVREGFCSKLVFFLLSASAYYACAIVLSIMHLYYLYPPTLTSKPMKFKGAISISLIQL